MKLKHIVLLAAFSSMCLVAGACNKDKAPTDNSSTPLPPPTEPTYQETSTEISLSHDVVVFCVGETFTLTAASKNTEASAFVWSVDGDAAQDVVALSQVDNSAHITALKLGKTKLIAAVSIGEHVYFKSVEVEVKEKADVVLLVNGVGYDENGYHAELFTYSTKEEEKTSVELSVSAYKNNEFASATNLSWVSDSPCVVVSGNKILANGEGKANIVGTCSVGGKEYSVSVSVTVNRPIIHLNQMVTLERENLAAFTIDSKLEGTLRSVSYDGETVGSIDKNTKEISIDKDALPKVAAKMGEGKTFFVETSYARYAFTVNLYTKIISSKEDLDSMAELAKKSGNSPAIWDGYFVLGTDIAYNAKFESKLADFPSLEATVGGDWSNGGLYGFMGVFDGKGHTIEGIEIENGDYLGSFVGVLHINGVIKNVSFTKAKVSANSGLVCGAGGGTISNVYIQYASMGMGMQKYEGDGSINTHCGSFFSFKEPVATANVSNCIIDVTNTEFGNNASIKIVGSEYASIKNVFVIGGSKALREKSNATLSFDSTLDFLDGGSAQSRYQKFDADFWSFEGGVPLPNMLAAQVNAMDLNVQEMGLLSKGTSYKLALAHDYVTVESSSESVSMQGTVVSVAPDAVVGEEITLIVTSMLDVNKFASFTFKVSAALENCVDLTSESTTAFYDNTLKQLFFAELKEKVTGEVLYFTNEDGSAVEFVKDGEPVQTVIAVTETGAYKFRSQTVTKVVQSAEDLHYVRRDYTVTQEFKDVGVTHTGLYDGILVGTFVMIRDIDATGLELQNSGKYWENSRGFRGTFDGRGYTIKNLSVGINGLFGALTHATIKNVNFTDVQLQGESGKYVSLFATRVFNTTMENVSVTFAKVVKGVDPGSNSGLLFYETTFDSTFKNITLDISKVASDVSYLTEAYYDEPAPYQSLQKSTYESITVILADDSYIPAFAYKNGTSGEGNKVAYPDGLFIFKDAAGNILA